MAADAPFRGDTLPLRLVREHARSSGLEPHRFAAALFDEARRRLTGGPEADARDALTSLARNALALYPVSHREGARGAITPEWLAEFHRLSHPASDHRRHGRWYTPRPIARAMARMALRARPSDGRAPCILDPACGCGALLVPAFEMAAEALAAVRPGASRREIVAEALRNIVAADTDPDALSVTRLRLACAAEALAGAPVPAHPRGYAGDSLTAEPGELVGDGADVVLMNPPYLGNRYFEALPDPEASRERLRRTFGWNDDLYVHFLHRAWDWLSPGGVLCAITPDTFLTVASKARTRDMLLTRALRSIVRVPPSAFGACVHTCITLAANAPPGEGDRLDYVDARAAPESAWDRLEGSPLPPGVRRWRAPRAVYARPGAPFFRPTPRSVALHARYLGPKAPPGFLPLGRLAPARDCGINSGNVRSRLFFSEWREGLARLIQGRQIERYAVRWDSPSARYRWVDIHYEPNPLVKGVGRGGRPSPHGETWGFRGDLALHSLPERLLLRQTEDDLVAALLRRDPADPIYTDNTLFTLALTDEAIAQGVSLLYLLALLNSAFVNELYHEISQEKGRSQAQVKVGYVNRLPVPIAAAERREAIEEGARAAMAAAEAGRDGAEDQRRLDALVASLYGAEGLPAPEPLFRRPRSAIK